MENASKALLMAGGILLGILILSGLILMWTNISKLQASQTEAPKEEQIMKFNQEFETYEGNNKIYGSDVISIMNKIESYNKKWPDFFTDKLQYENIKLSIDVNGSNKWIDLGIPATGLKDAIEAGLMGNTGKLKKYIDLENAFGKNLMSKLSASKTKIEELQSSEINPKTNHNYTFKEAVEKTTGINGLTRNGQTITPDVVNTYYVYTEFKTSKFECTGTSHNDNWQINGISFKIK